MTTTQVKFIDLNEAQSRTSTALATAQKIMKDTFPDSTENQAKLLFRVITEISELLNQKSKKGGYELEGQRFPESTISFIEQVLTHLESKATLSQDIISHYNKFTYTLPEAKAEDLREIVSAPNLSIETYQVTEADLDKVLKSTQGQLEGWDANSVKFQQGKVRDNYSLDDRTFVSIATDRLSANNIPNLTLIPYKGAVLTSMSNFWLNKAQEIGKKYGIGSHMRAGLESTDANTTIADKVTTLPVEVVVRRYLTGTAYGRYKKATEDPSQANTIFGDHKLAPGIKEHQRLNAIIIDPTTKGKDDIPVTDAQASVLVGQDDWENIKNFTKEFFEAAEQIASQAGIIIPDTKFEFGRTLDGKIVLIDEILTPDSSRFWFGGEAEGSYSAAFKAAQTPASFDKDPIRKWAASETQAGKATEQLQGQVPPELVLSTAQNYIRVHDLITGTKFNPDQDSNVLERIKSNLQKVNLLSA